MEPYLSTVAIMESLRTRPTANPSHRAHRAVSHAFVDGLFGGRDWLELHGLIQHGLERHAFTAATVRAFLARAVHQKSLRGPLRQTIVSDRSWKRCMAEGRALSRVELRSMVDIGDVIRAARRVYGGDTEAAERFLTIPRRELGGQPPIVVATTVGGAQAVRECLARIEEGAPV